jgi:hypothetical protein
MTVATIGKIKVDLEAQSVTFSKNIRRSQDDLHNLAESAKRTGEMIQTAFETIAIAEGVHILSEWVSESINSATAAYRLSASLGITTQSLMGMQAAARMNGVEAEAFNTSLNHLVKSLGETANGGGPAAEALNRLGISGKDLKGQKLDDVFTLIAQRISEVKDPVERGRAELELFGKAGQQLDPLLRQGAAGIEAAKAKAVELGIALSDIDAAKLVAAHEQLENVSMAVEGMKNQFAIAVAPVLSELTDDVLQLLPPAEQMRSIFITALRDVSMGVGGVIDVYHDLKAGILELVSESVDPFTTLLKVTNALAESVVWVTNKIFGTNYSSPRWIKDVGDEVAAMQDSIHQDAVAAWNEPNAIQAAKKFFDGIQNKADQTAQAVANSKPGSALADDFEDAHKRVNQTLAEMQAAVDDFGKTAAQKKLAQLQRDGATPQELARGQSLQTQLDVMGEQKKLVDQIAKAQADADSAKLAAAQSYQNAIARTVPAVDAAPAGAAMASQQAEAEKINAVRAAGERATLAMSQVIASVKGAASTLGITAANGELDAMQHQLAVAESIRSTNQQAAGITAESAKAIAAVANAGGNANEVAKTAALAQQLAALNAQKKASEEIAKLSQDIATYGMDAAAKTLADLRAAGASQADIDRVTALQQQLNVLEQQKKVQEELDRMHKEVQQAGMSDAQKQLDDLKRAGASDQQIGQAKQMADQLDAARQTKQLQEEAKSIIESSMTPLQKYQETVAKLDELRSRGLIDEQVYDAAKAKAEHTEDHKDNMDKKPERIERRFDFRLPTPRVDSNDPAHRALKEQQEANKSLRTIAKNSARKPRVVASI